MSDYLTPNMIVLLLASFVGVIAHYFSKYGRGEIQESLFGYLVIDHPGWTLATLTSVIAADAGIVAVGQIETMAVHMIAALGFATGWALDSGVSPRRDHDEERDRQ